MRATLARPSPERVPMITVHHLEDSRSQRVLWLLEELGLPYEVVRYARDPKTMLAPPELRKVHPLGKSPVVGLDDGEVLAESGAIVQTLAERHPESGLLPAAGTPARTRCTYWLHYAEGSAMPPLLLALVFRRVRESPAPFLVRPVVRGIADKVLSTFVRPQLATHFDWIESQLATGPWFAGSAFSVADIQMSFPLEAAASRGATDPQRHPRIADWLSRIHARPAYRRALERGGPYGYAD
jgi:glutathione S-transferase